jgi:hypothetical protein
VPRNKPGPDPAHAPSKAIRTVKRRVAGGLQGVGRPFVELAHWEGAAFGRVQMGGSLRSIANEAASAANAAAYPSSSSSSSSLVVPFWEQESMPAGVQRRRGV